MKYNCKLLMCGNKDDLICERRKCKPLIRKKRNRGSQATSDVDEDILQSVYSSIPNKHKIVINQKSYFLYARYS